MSFEDGYLTLSAPNSTNEVSMFKLAIEVCFENHFDLIHAMFLSLGSTKSGYFFLGHPVESLQTKPSNGTNGINYLRARLSNLQFKGHIAPTKIWCTFAKNPFVLKKIHQGFVQMLLFRKNLVRFLNT